MGFFSMIFGKDEPTVSEIDDAWTVTNTKKMRAEVKLEDLLESIDRTERLGDESDAEDLVNMRYQADVLRAEIELHRRRLEGLNADFPDAQRREAADALDKRTRDIEARIKNEYSKHLAGYERAAPSVAAHLAPMVEIENELEAVNHQRIAVGLPPIEHPHARFREPDVVHPEEPVFEERWVDPDGLRSANQGPNGPRDPNARRSRVQVATTSAVTIRGRSVDAPTRAVRLPSTTLGKADHWPKLKKS